MWRRLRPFLCSSSFIKPFLSSSSSSSPSSLSSALGFSHNAHDFFPLFSRSFASSGASNSNVVTFGPVDEMRSLLKKSRGDEKLPSVFYFYSSYCQDCGKCNFCALHKEIDKLSIKYPHVTFCRVEIHKLEEDQEGIEIIIKEQRLRTMPVFRFHKDGKIVAQVFGIYVADRVEETIKKFYNN